MLGGLGACLLALTILLGLRLSRGLEAGGAVVFVGALAVWVLAAVWVVRGRLLRRPALWIVLAVALACRLALAVPEPALSTDVYRYVWDGRVQAAGINPYRHHASHPRLRSLRDSDVYPRVSRRTKLTPYPPAAELAFGAIHVVSGGNVIATKLAFVAVDMAVIALLAGLLARAGRRPEHCLLYAWHPLAVVEVGQSGHVEVVMVAFLLAALHAAISGRRALMGALMACAAAVKPYALVVLPALLGGERPRRLARVGAGLVATLVVLYLPFLSVGSRVLGNVPGYLEEEGFTGGYRFHLLFRLEVMLGRVPQWPSPGTIWYLAGAAVVLGGLALWSLRTPATSPAAVGRRALLLFVAMLVVLTPSYPWYWLGGLALLPFARGRGLVVAAAILSTAPALYMHALDPGRPGWPLQLVYEGSFVVALAAVAWAAAGWLSPPSLGSNPGSEAAARAS